MKEYKLGELEVDESLLDLRPVNLFIVNRYAQAYRAGHQFPPLLIDKQTKKIISGNHRYQAMMSEFGAQHTTEVEEREFADRKDILVLFAKENANHGMPLTGFSKRKITLELLDEGVKDHEIANLFGVAVRRIEEWCGQTVAVTGSGGKTEYKPVKRGPKISGKKLSTEQYETHRKADLGIPPEELIDQLIRWFENEYIEHTAELVAKCETLQSQVTKYLNRK